MNHSNYQFLNNQFIKNYSKNHLQLQDSLNQIKEAESHVNGSNVEGIVPSSRFVQNVSGRTLFESSFSYLDLCFEVQTV